VAIVTAPKVIEEEELEAVDEAEAGELAEDQPADDEATPADSDRAKSGE
jgi:hypothetical protein